MIPVQLTVRQDTMANSMEFMTLAVELTAERVL